MNYQNYQNLMLSTSSDTNTDASILVYKFRPERTGFNMYAEYTRQLLTLLALHPCSEPRINIENEVFMEFKRKFN